MSDSTKLAKTHEGQMFINNEDSKKAHKELMSISLCVKEKLEKKYSNVGFSLAKDLPKSLIIEEVKKYCADHQSFQSNPGSAINPDGGIIYVHSKKQIYPLVISEMKKQGTNDTNAEKQAKGNAIERASKNIDEAKAYFINYKIFPYILFTFGCDFHKGSSIIDRITSANMYSPLNELYVRDHHLLGKRASLYVREAKWSQEEMSSALLDAAQQSIEYYIESGLVEI